MVITGTFLILISIMIMSLVVFHDWNWKFRGWTLDSQAGQPRDDKDYVKPTWTKTSNLSWKATPMGRRRCNTDRGSMKNVTQCSEISGQGTRACKLGIKNAPSKSIGCRLSRQHPLLSPSLELQFLDGVCNLLHARPYAHLCVEGCIFLWGLL